MQPGRGETRAWGTPEYSTTLRGGLELGDIELDHLPHGLHHAVALGRVLEQRPQHRGDDLPGEPAAVPQPAALHRPAAAGGELLPVVVDLGLVVAVHYQRDGLGEGE